MKKAFIRCALSVAIMATGAAALAPAVAGTVTGTAAYRERIALPADAVFEATLQDVSRADARAEIIGRSVLEPAGQTPFKFEISYDDKAIDPRHRYAVRATVRHQGKLLFTTDTHVPAFAEGNTPLTTPLQLRLVSANAQAAPSAVPATPAPPAAKQASRVPDSPLRNTYWKLVRLDGKRVVVTGNQREPHLVFAADEMRVQGNGGCNGIGGGFETKGNTLKIGNLIGTMMACDGMQQETAFTRALGTVERYRIKGNRLDMLNPAGKVVLRFNAVALR